MMRVYWSISKTSSGLPSTASPLSRFPSDEKCRYKSAISEALIEVERLNDMRGEKMNRVKLVEREKQALEGRKKEADVYLRDQNELVHNQSALFQVNMYHAMQNAEIYTTAVVSPPSPRSFRVDRRSVG